MAVIIAILCIVMGLGCIFAQDFLWKIQEYSNRTRGIVHSERTPEWEIGGIIAGIFGIVVGTLIFIAYAF